MTIVLCITGCGKIAATMESGGDFASGDGRDREAAESREALKETRSRRKSERSQEAHILVDEGGYGLRDQKTAYFIGDDLKDTFWVVDAETKTKVLEGELIRITEDEDGESIWKGDFSALQREGSYYIQTPVIGQSDVFGISRKNREALAVRLGDEWERRIPELAIRTNEDEFCRNADGLTGMAMAYELFEEQDEKSRQRLSDAAEKMSEAGKKLQQEDDPSERMLAAYTLTMAVLADVLVDLPECEDLKRQALSAYGRLDKGDEKSIEVLTAEAALYRLTGERRYAAGAEKYLSEFGSYEKENFYLVYCYLTTPKDVDAEICNDLMKKLIASAGAGEEKIAQEAPGSGREKQEDELFYAQLLTLADYVLVSREYRRAASEICHRLSMSGLAKPEDMTTDELACFYFLTLGNTEK